MERCTIAEVRAYWDRHLHDAQFSRARPGTPMWFVDLASYRYGKLAYLAREVDFGGFAGADLLEIGCGIGLDLVRFAHGGARVTGIDVAPTALDLARRHSDQQGVPTTLLQMDGERLAFEKESFDVVYGHGCLPYTPDPGRMVAEAARVLRPGGVAVLMYYNRRSWLMAMSRLTGVSLEHEDAPCFNVCDAREVSNQLALFRSSRVTAERFPVPTGLHEGWKAVLFNRVFVPAFHALPLWWTARWGWHLMVRAEK